jgi:hypothetical protein
VDETATCRLCGGRVRAVLTVEASRMWVDADPHPAGTVVVSSLPDGRIRARVLPGTELPAQAPAWRMHRVTCPASADFRRRRDATAPRCAAGCGYVMDPWLAEHGHRFHPLCDPAVAHLLPGAGPAHRPPPPGWRDQQIGRAHV